jgi:hypothetical protein
MIKETAMKPFLVVAAIGLAAVVNSACIVVPARRVEPAVVTVAPPGVVYVAPTYAIPGPGYVWAYHARFGWGWHHPQYGWHQGWR